MFIEKVPGYLAVVVYRFLIGCSANAYIQTVSPELSPTASLTQQPPQLRHFKR